MALQDLPRWIISSANYYYTENIDIVPIEVTGDMRNQDNEKYAELRIDGPTFKRRPGNRIYAEIEVNFLITIKLDFNESDYFLQKVQGQIYQVAEKDLLIYKYGAEVGDDESFIGCMSIVPLTRTDRAIRISNFGEVEADKRILQSSMEFHYGGEFDGTN